MSTRRRKPVRSATRSASDSEDQPPAMPTTPILSDSAKQHLFGETEASGVRVDLRDHGLQDIATLEEHFAHQGLVQDEASARDVRARHAQGEAQLKGSIPQIGGVATGPLE